MFLFIYLFLYLLPCILDLDGIRKQEGKNEGKKKKKKQIHGFEVLDIHFGRLEASPRFSCSLEVLGPRINIMHF
jgi:hypothetical protein